MSPRRPGVRQIEFGLDDLDEIVEAMAAIGAARQGWINLMPVIDPDIDVPPTPGALAVFNSRGPAVPMGTWTPGEPGDRERERASVGILHGSGTKALERLADAGLGLPPGWQRLQDHPRRGLVVRVAADADHAPVLDWTLAAMVGLARVPVTGRWLAGLYDR